MRYSSISTLALLAAPNVLAQPVNKAQNISTIQWTNCTTPLPGACGTLTVPLDYTNSSSRTLNLSMMRLDATVKPSKGSILINQGGPGLDGVTFTQQYGPMLQILFGGHYDIIGFDPRGTGKTLQIDCIPDPVERLRASFSSPTGTNVSNVALGTIWSYSEIQGYNCLKNTAEYGELMGTSFVARDMMQIVDALGEDGMLRYWGQSYGTVLGATAAAMFPDRIDKMVIDGVVDLQEYYEGWEYSNIPTANLVLEKYLETCLGTKNETACALYRPNATVASLTKQIRDLIDEVKVRPIIMGSNITTDIVTVDKIKTALDTLLRIQIDYATLLADYLNSILTRNATAYQLIVAPFLVTALPGSTVDAIVNIRCTDASFRTDNYTEIEARARRAEDLSYIFGDSYAAPYVICARWPFKAKGRYNGDFKTKTKNPMLIIGSPYDLRTPFKNAQKAHELFEGSALLQHNGYGHCVLYSPGQCAIKAIQNYFTNGTLPEPGTVCEQDFNVFSGKTSADSFKLAAS